MKDESILFLLLPAVLALFAGCSVDVAGAPCETDENCPAGQYCGSNKTCEHGNGNKDIGEPPADTGGAADTGYKDAGADGGVSCYPDDSYFKMCGQGSSNRIDYAGEPCIFEGERCRQAPCDGNAYGVDCTCTGCTWQCAAECESLPDAGTDGGTDIGTDAETDAGFDAGLDGGFDGGTDGGFDAGVCVGDVDCGGAHCCLGVCAPVDRGCCDEKDCLGSQWGNVCAKLACQCATEWDCSGPLRICDGTETPPSCIDGCTDAKCGPGKVCCDKACYGGDCCVDRNCVEPGKPTCRLADHRCTDACDLQARCGGGFLCCAGACRKGDCCANADCLANPNGMICVNYKCSTACTDDGNCPGGKCCAVGPAKGTCYTGDCCDDGQCQAPKTCGGGGAANQCGCTPESRLAFCARYGRACGEYTGEDNCGLPRTEQCGTCQGCASLCSDGACAPASHAYASCYGGDVWWFDSCGTRQDLKKDCAPTEVCIGTACCTPESDTDFCTRLGKNCLDVTALDNCGTQRTVNCGLCDKGWTCGLHEPNVCGCDSDPNVCAGKDCGQVVDNCGNTITCGTCLVPECCDYQCFDTQVDRNHCGDCATMCAWDEVCSGGKCAPKDWDPSGGVVNPGANALAHALGTNGTDPYVAWVGAATPDDGGSMGMNNVLTHQLVGGIWKQVGGTVSDPATPSQPVVDIFVKGGAPHVVYADGAGSGNPLVHLRIYDVNSSAWNDVGAPGYTPPCSALGSLALAPMDISGTPHFTLVGAGGCGIGLGYAYYKGNSPPWWETPMPPAVMKPGLITMYAASNSDVVNDGNRALLAYAERDQVTSATSVWVKWWNTMPLPGAWTDIGGPLNSSPLPQAGGAGPRYVSIALDPAKQPVVAFVEAVNNTKIITVKGFDPSQGFWRQIGGGLDGPGGLDAPFLAYIDGLPYVAFVEGGPPPVVKVVRFDAGVWQRVGAPISMTSDKPPELPYLVAAGKTPYVAFRQKDASDAYRIYVARFVPPP